MSMTRRVTQNNTILRFREKPIEGLAFFIKFSKGRIRTKIN